VENHPCAAVPFGSPQNFHLQLMDRTSGIEQAAAPKLVWHDDHPGVSAYLDRCQVDTPDSWIARVWEVVAAKRPTVGTVVEFGAGDGRFSCYGNFKKYIGYEVDKARVGQRTIPKNAELVNDDAFSSSITNADVCIGNPPYVRNQDLPTGWRETVAPKLKARLGIEISGLANAWQYFFFQSLASTHKKGLVALVVPYEWVSRPSSKALRNYIQEKGWSVDVYRLPDSVFGRVLTTASITVVDKTGSGKWRYFDTDETTQQFVLAKTASLGNRRVLAYAHSTDRVAVAKRGLSPGTQKVFVLTEGERVRHGLKRDRDVVPGITTLRNIDGEKTKLTQEFFEKHYVQAGMRCWLVRTDREPSRDLKLYLDSIEKVDRDTATCNNREIWWKFTMPETPGVLVSMGFRGQAPKCLLNDIGARAVGGVGGIYCTTKVTAAKVAAGLRSVKLHGRLVSYSNGLLKLEINQLNTLLDEILLEEN
jgi:Eco57I restriction-modification methylase